MLPSSFVHVAGPVCYLSLRPFTGSVLEWLGLWRSARCRQGLIQAADGAKHPAGVLRFPPVGEEVFRKTDGAEAGIEDVGRCDAYGSQVSAVRFNKI
jgi:hypothetical protein